MSEFNDKNKNKKKNQDVGRVVSKKKNWKKNPKNMAVFDSKTK